jgi:predicted nucleic acid-binding protein
VRLFLDTSVLLAASGSATGASREILRRATANNWVLIVTPCIIEEVVRNLPNLPPVATAEWARLRPGLLLMDDVLTLDRPVVFGPAKDRPILFSAMAWADVLLTLDRSDFGHLMDTTFYGLLVLKPGVFLERERAAGRLKAR